MPSFGAASKIRLASCHPDLQRLFNEVVKVVDCSVQVGHRNEEEQEKAFAEGRSQKHWPDGNHNKLPSTAVDVIPFAPGVDNIWNVNDPSVAVYWWKLTYAVLRIAGNLGIKVRWGNDWNSDGNTADTGLKDWPHWEIVE